MSQDLTNARSERTYDDALRSIKTEAETSKLIAETSKIRGETVSPEINARWNESCTAKNKATANLFNALADFLPQLGAFLSTVVEEQRNRR